MSKNKFEYHKVLFSFAKWLCPDNDKAFKACLNRNEENDVCISLLENLTYCGYVAYNEFTKNELESKNDINSKVKQNCENIIKERIKCIKKNQNDSLHLDCYKYHQESIHCFTKTLCPSLLDKINKCTSNNHDSINLNKCLEKIDTLSTCLSQINIK